MDDISTVILLKEIAKRIESMDTDDVFTNITEPSVQSLKESLSVCLGKYHDVILMRIQDNMESDDD